MRKKDETIIPFPGNAAAERGEQTQTAMNDIGCIITLLHETVEGERFIGSRVYLVEQLDKHFGKLDQLLSAGGA